MVLVTTIFNYFHDLILISENFQGLPQDSPGLLKLLPCQGDSRNYSFKEFPKTVPKENWKRKVKEFKESFSPNPSREEYIKKFFK